MSRHPQSDGRFDVVVIGAGAAGLVTASGSARLGARVALIEKDRFGGECLWTGCVPSKALIRSAAVLHEARTADRVGLRSTRIPLDFGDVMRSMRDVIARIQPHDDPERFRAMGVTTLRGTAHISGPGRVTVNGEELSTRRIVVATGSRPLIPPIDGLDGVDYLTHESILELERRPGRLLILGAGPIGLEFAQIFGRLGSEVLVVELAETILPREDAEVADHLLQALEGEGVRFQLSHRAIAARQVDGRIELDLQAPDGSRTSVYGDQLLVATGMKPFTESLGLENVGASVDSRGALEVNDHLRSTARGVWGAGDVTGQLFFTHVADYQARTLVRNMFFPFRARADYSRVPWATYTEPTLARVGLTEMEARERHGDRIGVYRHPFDDLDRAITDRATAGLVKLVTDRRGRLLGAHILGAHADALIHELALAMQEGAGIGALSQMVHAYPTWPEAIRRAADSYYAEKLGKGWIGRVLRWWVRR